MYIEQEGFSVLNQPIGVFQIGFPFADGFDLSAAESHTGLEFFKEEVVVAGGTILSSIAFAGSHGIAGTHGLLRPGAFLGSDCVAGLAGHAKDSSNFHRSIGGE